MKPKELAQLSALIFALAALLHLIRAIFQWPLILGDFQLPIWVSILLVLLAGYLAHENWKLGK